MSDHNNEIYSNAVRAGRRTYFFDVKATRGNDLYLTLTESKKSTSEAVSYTHLTLPTKA